MSPTASAHGPELDGPPKPRMPVAFDSRQEPGAEKPHAGIVRGQEVAPCSYRDEALSRLVRGHAALARSRIALHSQGSRLVQPGLGQVVDPGQHIGEPPPADRHRSSWRW